MPYIITARPACRHDDREGTVVRDPEARRAVATLEEARLVVMQRIGDGSPLPKATVPLDPAKASARRAAAGLTDFGGTVGPLPDGTVLEVGRVSWSRLAGDFSVPRGRSAKECEQIIAAYNASDRPALPRKEHS